MAENALSPGFVRLRYTANGHPHVQTFGVNLTGEQTSDETPVLNKGGGEVDLAAWLTETYAEAWSAFYNAADSLDEAEVWSQPTPADDPIFTRLIPIAVIGIAASPAAQIAAQGVLSLRTSAGGIAKVYLMEPRVALNVHDPRPFADNRVSGLGGVLVSGASCFYGRDNSYPILALTWNTKTNDALRKKYILNAG